MANVEATERRRETRKWKSGIPSSIQIQRQERDRKISERMAKRFFPGEPLTLLHLDIKYWLARRCGWDVEDAKFRAISKDQNGDLILSDPEETTIWLWWTSLHYETRGTLARISKIRLTNRDKSVLSGVTRMKKEEAEDLVRHWNENHTVGDDVLVELDDGEILKTKTRSRAEVVKNCEPVIWVDGIVPCYDLTKVKIRR